MGKTGGGTGTNQYQVRGHSQASLPIPVLIVLSTCGQIWGGSCSHSVSPPHYTHGNHPDQATYVARLQDPAAPPQLLASVLAHRLRLYNQDGSVLAANHPALPIPAMRHYFEQKHNNRVVNRTTSTLLRRPDLPADIVKDYRAMRPPLYDRDLIVRADAPADWLASKAALSSLQDLVAAHPNTAPVVRLQLAQTGKTETHRAMLFRRWEMGGLPLPRLDNETLLELVRSRDQRVRAEAISRLPADLRPSGPKLTVPQLMGWLAQPDCPPEIIQQGAIHTNSQVRATVVAHPLCPAETVMQLANDWARNVQAAVSGTPTAPVQALRSLAQYGDSIIRGNCAANPSCPPDVQMQLLRLNDRDIQRQLCRNPRLAPEAATILIGHRDKRLRDMVATNPNLPDHIRAILNMG